MLKNLKIPAINRYLAHKQCLLLDDSQPPAQLADVTQVTRDIVALHATSATSPYLSLWARVPGFQHEMLEKALYEDRTLAKVLCMRVTIHTVPGDEVPFFVQACRTYVEKRTPPRFRGEGLLVQAGICEEDKASALLAELHHRALAVLAERGFATVQEISDEVPELKARIRHDVGKPYEGEFSIGTRFVSDMCAQGLLIRSRPRGTWRSNLYEYTTLSNWLPGVDLESISSQQAQAWLVRRYLAAFGPATMDDVQWWTGFTKTDTKKALKALEPELVEVALEDLGDGYLMLSTDAERLHTYAPPHTPYVFFLPSLDPYVMGYHDRRRFLAAEHHAKLFDRAGNSVPTVWVNGQVVGAWGQHKDGSVIYRLLESIEEKEQSLLEGQARQMESFLGGEYLSPAFRTPFTRTLSRKES